LRVQELIPSDAEAKSLKAVDPSSLDALHEAEKCLYLLSRVAKLAAKVTSMIFMCEAEPNIYVNSANMRVMTEAVDKVLSSRGLVEIIRLVLQIGNLMNQVKQ
jgi:hypothetical protein